MDLLLRGARVIDGTGSPAAPADVLVRSVGIEHVWVNGEQIRSAGADLEARPGTLIRFSGQAKEDDA